MRSGSDAGKRRTRFRAMKTILLLTHTESSAFVAIKEAILPIAKSRKWAVHTCSVAKTGTRATNLVKTWKPDGCIVYAASPYGLTGCPCAWNYPTVVVNSSAPRRGAINILHDSEQTGRLVAGELLSLGLDNFAFFSTVSGIPWVENRYRTFASEMKRRGCQVIRYADGDIGSWLESLPKPCGIFAAHDLVAERVVAEAFARGIAVPDDIAVIGCDDDAQICEHAEVTITSVRLDFPRCAKLVADALECAMESKPCPSRLIYGDIGITRRASTRLLAGHPAQVSSMLEYIRLNAFSGISAVDVLRNFSGSRRTLENRFRKATGHSVLEEIHAVRLAEAERLLANPQIKIEAIPSLAGYSSANFLARIFKRIHGVSMREFRNRKI